MSVPEYELKRYEWRLTHEEGFVVLTRAHEWAPPRPAEEVRRAPLTDPEACARLFCQLAAYLNVRNLRIEPRGGK